MAFEVDANGNITIIQGDTGEFTITGLPTDQNYTAYFAFQDLERNPIGSEIVIQTFQQDAIVFNISSKLTDLLTVPVEDKKAVYYHGVKLCSEDGMVEDTLILGNGTIGGVNTTTVYPKKVEGVA